MIDPRTQELSQLVARLFADRVDGRPSLRLEGDALDHALATVRALTDEVAALSAFLDQLDPRVAEMSRAIDHLIVLDFTRAAPVGKSDDLLDGLATGVNLLAEELSASTLSKGFADDVIAAMNDLLIVTRADGAIRTVNQAVVSLLGHQGFELGERPLELLLPELSAVELVASGGVHGMETTCLARDGRLVPVSLSASVMLDSHGETQGLVCVARDLSASKRAEEERFRMREAEQRQAVLLAELSTPLLPIAPGVLVLPLIGSLDEQRAQWLCESLLHGIVAARARVAIIDITGVRGVDHEAVEGLMRAIEAAKLIGSTVVLAGIGPEVAQTFVRLDADLADTVTFGSLQRAIKHVLGRRRAKPPPVLPAAPAPRERAPARDGSDETLPEPA